MFEEYATLKEKALQHLDQAARFAKSIQKNSVAEQIELGRRTFAESRYNLAVIGDMNRGKSTLVNTLLGRSNDDLSPIRAKVCTAAITHYIDRSANPQELSEARIFFDDGREPQTVPIESLRNYITEEGNPDNIKGVRSVDAYGDFPLLNNVVTLVDTPGRGAVQRNHEILVEQFVPLADAIIFIIAADIPITASEKEFLKQLAQQEKERVFFVLTKRDEVEDKDINEVRRWVRDQISDAGMRCDRLFEVSARKVFEARRDGRDEATIEILHRESGMSELQCELERFILSTSTKNERTLTRLKGLLDYLRKFYEQAHAEVGESLSLISLDTEQLTKEIDDLNDRAVKVKAASDASLKKFQVAWFKSIDQFRKNLKNREDRISDQIINKISRGGIIGVASGSFKAKELIERSISNELQSLLPDLDLKLSEHVTALSAELESELETYRRVKAQFEFALPSAAILGLGGSAIALTQAYGATSAAVSTIIGILNQGMLAKGKVIIMGGPTVLSAATPAILAIATAYAASWAAKKIIIAAQENRIPAMVAEAIDEIAQDVGVRLEERCSEIAHTFRAAIEEQIETDRAKILEIEQSIKDSDPSIKIRLTVQVDECKTLMDQHKDLTHSLKLITSVQ